MTAEIVRVTAGVRPIAPNVFAADDGHGGHRRGASEASPLRFPEGLAFPTRWAP